MDRLNLFSVDDHVIEAPHALESRLPAKLRERGPRLISTKDDEYWTFDGERVKPQGIEASAGKKPTEFTMGHVRYEDMRPGYYDAAPRLLDMDEDGVRGAGAVPVGRPAHLRQALLRQPRQGARPRVHPGVERLHRRGVVRRRARPLRAARHRPDVGPAALRRRDPAHRPRRGRAASRSARARTCSASRRSTTRTGTRSGRRSTETDLAVCLHIGSSGQSLAPQPGGPTAPSVVMIPLVRVGRVQRAAVLAAVPQVARPALRPQRGRHRLGAVHARALRVHVAPSPLLDR